MTPDTWGLVRNEGKAVANIEVKATLYGNDDALLESPSAIVPVQGLRSGEPGPFALQADTQAADVARIEWTVSTSAPKRAIPRDFQILQNWDLPYGDRAPFDLVYSDPQSGPPYPYVLSGDVDNLAGASPLPTVVAAWVDETNKVRWVESAEVGSVPFNPGKAPRFPDVLNPRVKAPFYIVVEDPIVGPGIGTLRPMLWAVAP